MTIAAEDAQQGAAPPYRAMWDFVQSSDDTLPGTFENTKDDPLLGIPLYAVFDPRVGEGAVLSDIHSTPSGPRYATRKDFMYGRYPNQ
ncbi:hypothetical protein ACFRIB_02920 [Streptomyces mirabilis]|uniref:hypothetical protein n=1 Tax=Streptomyces mirabilis TaxID=68239 RepID=UPI003327261C